MNPRKIKKKNKHLCHNSVIIKILIETKKKYALSLNDNLDSKTDKIEVN